MDQLVRFTLAGSISGIKVGMGWAWAGHGLGVKGRGDYKLVGPSKLHVMPLHFSEEQHFLILFFLL
jgi:hypothetical protein